MTARDGGNAKGLSGTILALYIAAPVPPCTRSIPVILTIKKNGIRDFANTVF